MQVGSGVLTVALWLAVGVVSAASVGLIVVLVREWRNGELW